MSLDYWIAPNTAGGGVTTWPITPLIDYPRTYWYYPRERSLKELLTELKMKLTEEKELQEDLREVLELLKKRLE